MMTSVISFGLHFLTPHFEDTSSLRRNNLHAFEYATFFLGLHVCFSLVACKTSNTEPNIFRLSLHSIECFASVLQQRGYGAMVARLTPDQKVGRSNRSGLIFLLSDAMEVAMRSPPQDLPEK